MVRARISDLLRVNCLVGRRKACGGGVSLNRLINF